MRRLEMPKHEPSPKNHLRGNAREGRINTGNAAGKCFLDRLGVAAPTSRVVYGDNKRRTRYLSGPSNRVWRCQRNGIALENGSVQKICCRSAELRKR